MFLVQEQMSDNILLHTYIAAYIYIHHQYIALKKVIPIFFPYFFCLFCHNRQMIDSSFFHSIALENWLSLYESCYVLPIKRKVVDICVFT